MRKHVVLLPVYDVETIGQIADPSADLPLLQTVQAAELRPGPGAAVVHQPVLRDEIVRAFPVSCFHRCQKHLFVIAPQAVHAAAGAVKVHHEQKRLQRISSPVYVVSQKIELISFFRGELYLFQELLKLRQGAVYVADHIG